MTGMQSPSEGHPQGLIHIPSWPPDSLQQRHSPMSVPNERECMQFPFWCYSSRQKVSLDSAHLLQLLAEVIGAEVFRLLKSKVHNRGPGSACCLIASLLQHNGGCIVLLRQKHP